MHHADPVRRDRRPDQRQLCDPRRRIRWTGFQDLPAPLRHQRRVVRDRRADDDERRQHQQREQQDHRQRREPGAIAEARIEAQVKRPRRRAEDRRPDERREEWLQHEEAADDQHRQHGERQRLIDARRRDGHRQPLAPVGSRARIDLDPLAQLLDVHRLDEIAGESRCLAPVRCRPAGRSPSARSASRARRPDAPRISRASS